LLPDGAIMPLESRCVATEKRCVDGLCCAYRRSLSYRFNRQLFAMTVQQGTHSKSETVDGVSPAYSTNNTVPKDAVLPNGIRIGSKCYAVSSKWRMVPHVDSKKRRVKSAVCAYLVMLRRNPICFVDFIMDFDTSIDSRRVFLFSSVLAWSKGVQPYLSFALTSAP